jgi:hypothetical protein
MMGKKEKKKKTRSQNIWPNKVAINDGQVHSAELCWPQTLW